jgi:nitrate reductase NapAB chaperone NapD
MIITGSALFVEPGGHDIVLAKLEAFPEVTFHVKSECGTQLIVNLEAENHGELEELCTRLNSEIDEIIEIGHFYASVEEEVAKLLSNPQSDHGLGKPDFWEYDGSDHPSLRTGCDGPSRYPPDGEAG